MITPEELFDSFNKSKIDDRYENRISALKARDFKCLCKSATKAFQYR